MRTHQVVLFTLLMLSITVSPTASSQIVPVPICGPEVREEVALELENIANLPVDDKLDAELALYQTYAYCANETIDTSDFVTAANQCGASVSQLGSLFYEEMSCCGYDPQRRQFGCPVKVKQRFGFGGAPLPGSREYVLHCVRNTNGSLVPVGDDSVHLANEIYGTNPSWQFAVIANANDNLNTVYPMNGQTRNARSILSWGFRPTSCNFLPIWGNALNYKIRLDQ
ncbi:hypothetical protein [Microbulbifer discodermiae]|uniref:hypothetical protein n=1 Tax=Microbulbifer sp. 2201CG32-9 TaxID=3232309 RepID=UPI00345C20E0